MMRRQNKQNESIIVGRQYRYPHLIKTTQRDAPRTRGRTLLQDFVENMKKSLEKGREIRLCKARTMSRSLSLCMILVLPVVLGFISEPRLFFSRKRFVSRHLSGTDQDETVLKLQKELFQVAEKAKRGFQATLSERKRARELIFDLARLNPTPEPAASYYNETSDSSLTSLAGKWTLIYTDAPDIVGLDGGGPFATAKLGRIGQECSPPFIKNVIEWKRPDWAKSLPFSGTDESRVFQKVITEAKASPAKPLIVDLRLAGIEVVAPPPSNATSLESAIQTEGLPAAWFQSNPLKLKGPLTAPFGQFEVLYLDNTLRIIKTGQNYLAVNVRNNETDEWF